jgi:hypothetical protein
MLRGNLSSRPFYNERLVSLVIALVAVAAVALAAFNGYKIYALSTQRAELKARVARDTAQAQEIERQAAGLQRNVNRTTLSELAVSTQEANALIDHRTFSWTVFFGLVEKTLPFDLHLVSITPRVEKGDMRVTIGVVARQFDDIDTFMDNLQNTGSFYDVVPRNTERTEDDGTFKADIVAYYLAPNNVLPAAAKGSATQGKGRP